MDGGFGDNADGGRADAVPGASTRRPDEPGRGLRITKQDDHVRVPVPYPLGGMPVWVRREDHS